MKKKKMALAIACMAILAVGTTVFVGCSKENENSVNTKKVAVNSSLALNEQNPYEEVGISHNSILEESMNNVMLQKEITGSCDIGYAITTSNIISSSYGYDTTYGRQISLAVIADSNNNFAKAIDNYVSAEVKDVFNSILDDIYTLGNSDETDYGKYKEIIVNYEDQIISGDFSDEDKQILLSGTSVFRHSLYFWDNSGYEFEQKSVWKWITVGVADAAGALCGTATGITAGTTLGVGPVVGGIAGGIVGAVGASASAASLYDNLEKEVNEDDDEDENQE